MPPLKRRDAIRAKILPGVAAALLACLLGAAADAGAVQVEASFGKGALPYDWITGVFLDGSDLWVGTKSGTRIYSLADKSWRSPPEGFSGSAATGLARFGGSLYVATEAAVNVVGPDGIRVLDRIENAHAQNGRFAVSADRMWMAARTMVGGLLEFDGSSWKLLSRGPGTGVMNNITCLLAWKGELWAGTVNNGIFRSKSGVWSVLGPEDGLPGLWVTSLAGTEEGVYAGTPEGLGFFDGAGWKIYREKDGLPSNKISTLAVHKDKLIVGTFDRGIAVLQGRRFETVNQAKGMSDNRVEALETAGDDLWVGTVNGLNRLTGF